MDSNKKTIISLVVVFVVIILVVIGIVLNDDNSDKNPASDLAPNVNTSNSQNTSNIPSIGLVPGGISAPDQDSTTPSNVAKPSVVLPAAPGSDSSYRNLSIKIQNDKFSPDTIIVNQNDVINLNILAVDKNYDFTQFDYGFKFNILKGENKTLNFQASASGKFTFFCSSCGGPQKGPIGYIEIIKK